MKPYCKIYRPDNYSEKYLLDSRYANDRNNLIHSYHLLEKDLIKIFDYVELSDDNLQVYSHRIYELLLRVCTEFESNCKGILIANGYEKNQYNIKDYFKIKESNLLCDYEVKLNIWSGLSKSFFPFKDWENLNDYGVLSWYKDYNFVKHNRSSEFRRANLGNLINAICGVFVTLFTQFNREIFYPYQNANYVIEDDNGYVYIDNSLFSIKKVIPWTDVDFYKYDWDNLKNTSEPFAKYTFNH